MNSIALVVINVFLNIVLIPRFGGLGAAVASGIGIVAINLARLSQVYYLYRIHPYTKHYMMALVAGGLSVVSLYFLRQIEMLSGYILFAMNIAATAGIFLILFSLSVKTEEDRHVLNILKAKVSNLFEQVA